MKKRVVHVFGNELEEQDNLVVRLVPELRHRFKQVAFRISDPTESLEPSGDPWIILDVGMGIEEVVVVEDLDDLDSVKGQSVHDYDVYMELRLKEKLGKLPKVKIIIVPYRWQEKPALAALVSILSRFV